MDLIHFRMVMPPALTQQAVDLLGDLRRLGVDRTGSIAVDDVDMMFSRHAEQIEADQPSALVHTPLWAAVEAHIRAEGTYPPSFYLASTAVAAAGCGREYGR
ncbi:hypothetical protein ACFWIO_09035 [Streptomyces diastatochromogenes]|uniref:hypothetical protein n=1 Tax=Streptomyces diastatochromogenes TaxID=42236 RepID=UPI0036596326